MEKKDGNERSTTSKVLFGTFLTNGIVMSVGGFILFLIGMNARNSIDHQLHRLFGGNDYAGLIMGIGALVLIIGISLICVHLVKKKK